MHHSIMIMMMKTFITKKLSLNKIVRIPKLCTLSANVKISHSNSCGTRINMFNNNNILDFHCFFLNKINKLSRNTKRIATQVTTVIMFT